ncbi:MAG: DNA methyltransferase [Dehalococcoidia bacterium]
MNAQEFAAKWKASTLKESQGDRAQFEDICRLVGHPTPSDADPDGSFFVYQRRTAKDNGRLGFADVWYKGHFGWEFKSKGDDLEEAYRQLLQYRDTLENPPLLIVSDFERFSIRTNFTGFASRKYDFTLDDIASDRLIPGAERRAFALLRAAFFDPETLRPQWTPETVTKGVAGLFGRVADSLRGKWKHDDHEVARFLSKLIFCMFASDVRLLPAGIIGRLIEANLKTAPQFSERLEELFRAMRLGGHFGADAIPYFDGGLFSNSEALVIDSDNLRELRQADDMDWSEIEPSIFGTLFERILDPTKRRQLGLHYTSREDIELLVEPVVMWPLRREWEALKEEVAPLLGWQDAEGADKKEQRDDLWSALEEFLAKLARVKILDPACGSGNFLYVSLAMLKDLEREVMALGAETGLTGLQPRVHPRQLYGIEKNEYAHELASIVVWIGYLQWKYKNGIPMTAECRSWSRWTTSS